MTAASKRPRQTSRRRVVIASFSGKKANHRGTEDTEKKSEISSPKSENTSRSQAPLGNEIRQAPLRVRPRREAELPTFSFSSGAWKREGGFGFCLCLLCVLCASVVNFVFQPFFNSSSRFFATSADSVS